MMRNMELVRKILFKIEETVDNVAVSNLEVEGYTMDQVAYHCELLFGGGYIYNYEGQYVGGSILSFEVRGLTWKGHDFLDKIRHEMEICNWANRDKD